MQRINKYTALYIYIIIYIFIHSFISIQPQRPGWQEPEPSHVTGMALAHCIVGKFLGVVYHCFSPIYIYIYNLDIEGGT